MKLITLDRGQQDSPGAVLSDGTYLDLSVAARVLDGTAGRTAAPFTSIVGILKAGRLEEVRRLMGLAEEGSDDLGEALRAAGGLVQPDEARLRAPVPDPSLILAQGMAYREHLEEMDAPVPAEPAWFMKASSSVIGSGEPIVLPGDHGDMVDWEGELSLVIGRPCFQVEPEEAMDCVAGYTIINDISARDWVALALNPDQAPMDAILAWGKNIAGKQYPSFTPMGPVLLTAEEVADPHDLTLTTKVNGEVMQDAHTSDLIFRIPDVIAYLSQWHALRAGDVITTGSPSGVGYAREPRVFLGDGDVVEITVTGIGTLSNPVRKA